MNAPRRFVALALLFVWPSAALANPQGGVVQGGVATITGQGTGQVDVHQSTPGAVLSWEQFNIAPGEVTRFHQPNASATAVNKILQQDPSRIFGALEANGNVYLINPNGFLFGASARVNTRGFVAATSAEDLVKLGGYDASATSAAGAKIENHGQITTGDGGFVYLVAPRIENGRDAVITTPQGEVLLAAGATVTLTDDPSGIGVGIQYTAPGAPGSEAVNLGKLVANGGFARMRGDLVRQAGTVQANAVRERDGKIELYAANELRIESGARFVGASEVKADAGGHVEIAAGAQVALASDPAAEGEPIERHRFTLRSARHVSVGAGAALREEAASDADPNVWDVDVVAGADLANVDPLATRAGSDGGVYLSGANRDASGAVTSLGAGNGEVALARGDLRIRAANDVVVGNGGGLKNERGAIDVAAGRDVRFRAGSQTQDGVIENGSGDVRVRAGRDVLLVEDASVRGNAAIRTRGVIGTDAQGRTTVSRGGSVVVEAGRDVDAGVGNRWLEPGSNLSPAGYRELARELGLPDDFAIPDFDPIPVVREGILGIGTEAGGDVTIVAGRNMRTGASSQPRSGATASLLGTQYNGSHIGVFGRPVTRELDPIFGTERNAPIAGAAESDLLVIAGGTIEGEYVVRNGVADLRAGYALANGADARALTPASLAASLIESATALLDPRSGWLGTLARPLTVDSIEASVFGTGRNGVAIRAIENPSLVYPPSASSSSGVYAVPTWRPSDSLSLRSTHGDVHLIGNDIVLPVADSATPLPNALVRLLPPNVRIETDRGDLVLLNDFALFPSESGGLDLDVAGQVRTAGFSASSAAMLTLFVETLGGSGDVPFTIPAGTRLRDPSTGAEFTLAAEVRVNARTPALPAVGKVVFRPTANAASGTVRVPTDGSVRVTTSDGRLYEVIQSDDLAAPAQRYSEGEATFFATGGGVTAAILVPSGTVLTDASGRRFSVTRDGAIQPGQSQITLSVRALAPGVDAPAFGLSLATPIAGIDRATNLGATARPTEFSATVRAIDAGAASNSLRFDVTALVTPVAGIESVSNRAQLGGGVDLARVGVGTSPIIGVNPGGEPVVRASVLGPTGELPAGTRLVLASSIALPAGVRADEVSILVNAVGLGASAVPSIYRSLRDEGGALHADPTPGGVVTAASNEIWARDGSGTSARIVQSDAFPDVDARGLSGNFSYATYFASCRSGQSCQLGTFGTRPTHAGAPTIATLRALGGFERVGFELAEPAFALTGDAGPDGIFGTADDGADGSIFDFSLITQHTRPTDETTIWVPIGDARFGSTSPAPSVDPDLLSGLQVAGPGSASLWVGVLPNAPQLDLDGNGRIDPHESTGDRDGDGAVDRSEWRGDDATFTNLDEAQRVYTFAAAGPSFASRLVIPGAGDGGITAAESPFVPSGRGGRIELAAGLPASQAPLSLGVSAIGNVRNARLPRGSADVEVAAAGTIDLGGRGSIETYQGGRIVVESVGGSVLAGTAPAGYSGRRGIVTLSRASGFGDAPAEPFGGGAIAVDAGLDFDIGGLAVAALSGGDIEIASRGGSIDAGESAPFSSPSVFVDPSGTVLVTYTGGGIYASTGNVTLAAKQDVRIGAGITGNNINIDAGGSLLGGGAGGISGANVNVNVSGSISGSISASGSVNIAGGSVSQGASLSAGGIVAGAGSGVGSNTSGGKFSSELSELTDKAGEVASAGFQTAQNAATRGRGVRISVTSRVLDDEDE